MLKQILLSGALALPIMALNANAQQKPASVFITAGQSNADGRVYNSEIVDYLKPGYKYLHYANVTSQSSGTFTTRNFDNTKERWAFCDVTNYFIEQALQQDFYAIKTTCMVCRPHMDSRKQRISWRHHHGQIAHQVAHRGFLRPRRWHSLQATAGLRRKSHNVASGRERP